MRYTIALIAIVLLFITGCSSFEMDSGDSIVRGCSMIAYAIITSAVIRAIFNK